MIGYLFMVLKVSYHLKFLGWYHIPFSESMSAYIGQVGQISVIDQLENSFIWKSTSNCIERRFQNFVILKFGSKHFLNKTRKTEFGTRFWLWQLMIYFQMLDISVSDESPCRETSKFKISAHLDMSVKNGERFLFWYYIG